MPYFTSPSLETFSVTSLPCCFSNPIDQVVFLRPLSGVIIRIMDKSSANRLPPLPVDRERLEFENLAPIIESMRAGTYTPSVSKKEIDAVTEKAVRLFFDDETKEGQDAQETARNLWERLKVERNALVAIFISEIWNAPASADERSALARKDGGYAAKIDAARELFETQTFRWFSESDKHGASLRPLVRRFEEMIVLRDRLTRGESPTTFIYRGISTAQEAAANLPRIVLAKVEEAGLPLSGKEKLEIVRRAYRNLGITLASMNQSLSPLLMESFWQDDSLFFLEQGDDGVYVLKIHRDRMMGLRDFQGTPVFERLPFGETTRCPAMYPTGGHPPVVPEFFKWALEILENSDEFRSDPEAPADAS